MALPLSQSKWPAGPVAIAVAEAATARPVARLPLRLPPRAALSDATSAPPSNAARRARRVGVSGWSSAAASERRARKMRVSTAPCESSISAATSRYESPFHSRRRIARRCCSGSEARASSMPSSSSFGSCGMATNSSISCRSPGRSTRRRRQLERCFVRQTFCATLYSQACATSGSKPERRLRQAFK